MSDGLETWHTSKRDEPYNVCINDDPGLTLTFTTRSTLFILAFTLEGPSALSNIFSLETTVLIEVRFYMEHLSFAGTKKIYK